MKREQRNNDLAIIGLRCEFPGAPDAETFWQNLRDGVCSISFFGEEELEASGVRESLRQRPNYVPARGVLQDIARFDPAPFHMSPMEARITDPQHRLMLMQAWTCLEDAGYDPARFDGAIGLFTGAVRNDYLREYVQKNSRVMKTAVHRQMVVANDREFLSSFISYKLDLRGPSLNVQAACATSLSALHLAGQSLLSGECEIALAGSVCVTMPQKVGYLYREGLIHSPDGYCRAFDVAAKGTVMSQASAMVALKRLSDAEADRDHIHAVINATAVNNDGASKLSFSAPSAEGQAHLIEEALAVAGLAPEDISFVEAHGTGTELGDPVEADSLGRCFLDCPPQSIALGAVKTNIGHTETVSGLAGLIKTVLALRHRRIPPTLHFTRPNPKLQLEQSPFWVNTDLIPWERKGEQPRRAGVNAFGVGGVNAHVILEEAPAPLPTVREQATQLLVFSAADEQALQRQVTRFCEHMETHPELPLDKAAYTLQVGRALLEYRAFAVCRQRVDLGSVTDAARPFTRESGKERAVVWMVPDGLCGGDRLWRYREMRAYRAWIDCWQTVLADEGLGEFPWGDPQVGTTAFRLVTLAHTCGELALWHSWLGDPAKILARGVGALAAGVVLGQLTPSHALELLGVASYAEPDRPVEAEGLNAPLFDGANGLPLACPADWDSWRGDGVASADLQPLLDVPVRLSFGGAEAGFFADAGGCVYTESEETPPATSLLGALGQLWAAGVSVNWDGFHDNDPPGRVPLPTYPFSFSDYWVEPDKKQAQAPALPADKTSDDPADWCYVPSWKRAAPMVRLRQTGVPPMLVLAGDLCPTAAALQARGHDWLISERGVDGTYPATRLDGFFQRSEGVPVVVYLHALQPGGAGEAGAGENLFFHLLGLVRALNTYAQPGRNPRLILVTGGAREVLGGEQGSARGGVLFGLRAVLEQEFPAWTSLLVDVLPGEATAEDLARELEAYGCLADPPPLVARRGAHYWLPDYQPLALDQQAPTILRERGVYLITGGMGGLGFETARYLAAKVRARLVLVQRSGDGARETAGESPVSMLSRDHRVCAQTWARAAAEVRLDQCVVDRAFETAVDAFCAAHAYRYLFTHGRIAGAGESLTRESLYQALGLRPVFQRFVDFFLSMLAQDGYLAVEEDRVRFLRPLAEAPDPAVLAAQIETAYPKARGITAAVSRAVGYYPDALSGRKQALEALYSKEHNRMLDEAIKGGVKDAQHRLYCLQAGMLVKHLAEQSPRPLRVLEIGGGIGFLTRLILPMLRDTELEYTFTDISPYFLAPAGKWIEKAGYEHVIFKTFDISKDPLAQGFDGEAYDVVLGMNVVHAAKRIEPALDHLRRLLVPGGLLALIEESYTDRWVQMYYGLASGWWHFEDDLRHTSPLLSLSRWEEVIGARGFEGACAYPRDPSQRAESICGLVLAHTKTRPRQSIEALTELGAEVLVCAADVADPAAMAGVFSEAEARFGAVNGVVHAAGLAASGMISRATAPRMRQVLAPKMQGTQVLAALLAERKADFLVLFSSLNGTIGGLGKADYSAANAYLDAFAEAATGSDLRTLSLVWGEAWSEVGMAARGAEAGAERTGLKTREGVAVFAALLARLAMGPLPVALVSKTNLNTRLAILEKRRREKSAAARAVVKPAATVPGDIADVIRGLWCDFLGLDSVEDQDDFFDLGGDSLVAVQVVAHLKTRLGIDLDANTLMDHSTIEELVAHIEAGEKRVSAASDPCLVVLQKGRADLVPLFLIHAGEGRVFHYRHLLPYIGAERPVYGIQAVGLNGKRPLLESIEAMAAHYAAVFTACHPSGICLLGGSSLGGAIAFEMAQLLRKRQREIGLLFMVDSPLPKDAPFDFGDEAAVLAYMMDKGVDFDERHARMAAMDSREQKLHFLGRGQDRPEVSAQEMAELTRFLTILKVHAKAIRDYRPQTYPGDVLFFRAAERDQLNPANPERDWHPVIAGRLEVVEAPGNHISMNFPPNVAAVGHVLAEYLAGSAKS